MTFDSKILPDFRNRKQKRITNGRIMLIHYSCNDLWSINKQNEEEEDERRSFRAFKDRRNKSGTEKKRKENPLNTPNMSKYLLLCIANIHLSNKKKIKTKRKRRI